MATHELKTDPQPFKDVLDGKKTFEIRLNDRSYAVGDHLRLRETKFSGSAMKDDSPNYPLIYTGREIGAFVTHVMQGQYGLQEDWCILSIKVGCVITKSDEALDVKLNLVEPPEELVPRGIPGDLMEQELIARYANAFTEWETAWRLNPTEFLTEKEVRAMNVGDAGQRSAIYFNALMRKVAA